MEVSTPDIKGEATETDNTLRSLDCMRSHSWIFNKGGISDENSSQYPTLSAPGKLGEDVARR